MRSNQRDLKRFIRATLRAPIGGSYPNERLGARYTAKKCNRVTTNLYHTMNQEDLRASSTSRYRFRRRMARCHESRERAHDLGGDLLQRHPHVPGPRLPASQRRRARFIEHAPHVGQAPPRLFASPKAPDVRPVPPLRRAHPHRTGFRRTNEVVLGSRKPDPGVRPSPEGHRARRRTSTGNSART
ncbi:MAG: hypothetical protein JWM87_528 [Candidatus Eremiobacteraeota bacterium]|nr:hypothetical protein [Candidatus Eremiobacteraeota bacterium]